MVALVLGALTAPQGHAALAASADDVPVLVRPHDARAADAAIRAAGGHVQVRAGGQLQALVPRDALPALRRQPALAGVAPAPVASADAVTSQGVALLGADSLHALGRDGTGVRIAVLDQAFGPVSRLDQLAGLELPPPWRQHRTSFDATYGLAGRDYNANASRHGEFVTELVYDVAPGADYWFVNYRTSLEFGLAVDYLVNVVKPDVV